MEHLGWKRKIEVHPRSSAASCFSMPYVIGQPCYFFWILYEARCTVLTEAFLLLSQGCTALLLMSFHVGGFFSHYWISSNGFPVAKEKREIWCNAMMKEILTSSQSKQSSFWALLQVHLNWTLGSQQDSFSFCKSKHKYNKVLMSPKLNNNERIPQPSGCFHFWDYLDTTRMSVKGKQEHSLQYGWTLSFFFVFLPCVGVVFCFARCLTEQIVIWGWEMVIHQGGVS